MSNIHSILPLLDDDSWRWQKPEIDRESIGPGNQEALFQDPRYTGFVYFASLGVQGEDSELAQIQFDFDKFESSRSFEDLFRVGLTESTGISPSITRYDTGNDRYAARISPQIPIAYTDNASLTVRAPSNTGITIDAVGLNLEILDGDLFAESYQRATAGQIIENFQSMTDQLSRLNQNMESFMEQFSDFQSPQNREEQNNGNQNEDTSFIDEIV